MIPRFRYSLRAFLIVTAMVALAVGHLAHQAGKEHRALLAVKEAGGWSAHESIFGRWFTVPAILQDSLGPESLGRTVGVAAPYRMLSDGHLAELARLSRLKRIRTNFSVGGKTTYAVSNRGNESYCPPLITDQGLAHLSRAQSLEVLILFNTAITDSGMDSLSQLQNLKVLKIASRQITDAAIPHLSKLKSLEMFWTTGTSITETGIKELVEALPSCKVMFARKRFGTLDQFISALQNNSEWSLTDTLAVRDQPLGPAAAPKLIQLLSADQQETRCRAADALGRLADPADVVVPALLRFYDDPDQRFHHSVVRALWEIGPDAKGALPILLAALHDPNESHQASVAMAIWKIDGDRRAVDALVQRLTHDEARERRIAADFLRLIGPEHTR